MYLFWKINAQSSNPEKLVTSKIHQFYNIWRNSSADQEQVVVKLCFLKWKLGERGNYGCESKIMALGAWKFGTGNSS